MLSALFRICLQAERERLLILSFTALYWARDWRSVRLVHRWNHLWRASGHFVDHVSRREIMGMWMGVQQLLCNRVLIRLIDGHRQMFCNQTMLSTHNVISLIACRSFYNLCELLASFYFDIRHGRWSNIQAFSFVFSRTWEFNGYVDFYDKYTWKFIHDCFQAHNSRFSTTKLEQFLHFR